MGFLNFFKQDESEDIQTRRPDYKALDARLKKEEEQVKSSIYTEISFEDAKVGDVILINNESFDIGDIVQYMNLNTGVKFIKYELVGEKTSKWLMANENIIRLFNYITNFPEATAGIISHNDDEYEFFEKGVFLKESIRKYDNDPDVLDKTCEYSMYKNSKEEIIIIEETNEFKDTSIGNIIDKDNIIIKRNENKN